MAGPLWTTCGRRLDETVLQAGYVLWTGDGVKPLLAESWDTPDGGQTWVFNLRQGVKWHDGEDFNADDVVFSYNLFADPVVASVYAAKLIDVKGYQEFRDGAADSLAGVTKIDDYTVQISLAQVTSPAGESAQHLHQHSARAHSGRRCQGCSKQDPYWTENRVGTGPFKWAKYVPDQYVEVVRNDDYFWAHPRPSA